jgi:8-oxo-dGTP pyrophosphatase MutT (NUDIX family)
MAERAYFDLFLSDDRLTRGLGDEEARLLIEWLADRVERNEERLGVGETCLREVMRLCLRMRSVSRFVRLWCHDQARGAACQLAATERFSWSLPGGTVEPFELMLDILDHEDVEQDQRIELLAPRAAA